MMEQRLSATGKAIDNSFQQERHFKSTGAVFLCSLSFKSREQQRQPLFPQVRTFSFGWSHRLSVVSVCSLPLVCCSLCSLLFSVRMFAKRMFDIFVNYRGRSARRVGPVRVVWSTSIGLFNINWAF